MIGHPHFLNQLSQGLDIISMAGEWLAATTNTNMFTYEIAPVFIMMEHEVNMVVKSINCKTKSLQKKNLRWYLIPNQIEYFLKPFLKVLNKMREIIGFHLGDSILAPGGSISNMYALIIARHRYYPNHKHHGMRAILEHLIVYTSEEVSFISIKHSEKNYCYTIILFVKLT